MKQIINQEKLTHGLFKIIYSDGSMEYRSVEYTYEYPQFTKNEKLGLLLLKSGITGGYFTSGEFLRSKKRDNPGIKFIRWEFDNIPNNWDNITARKYQNLKDKLFKNYMEPYRVKYNNHIGEEFYESDNTCNLNELINNTWDKARKEAHDIIVGAIIDKKSSPGMSYRPGQEQQTDTLYENLINKLFTEGELPPGLGKTPIFYFLGKKLDNNSNFNSRVKLYVTDTVKNTTELVWKMYNYNLIDKKVLPNIVVVNSEEPNNNKIMKSGARVIPAMNGENPSLINLLKEIISNNEEYNLFTTYYSLGELLKAINDFDDFPLMPLFRDEAHVSAEKNIDHQFNAFLVYKHLFWGGVGLTGSAIRRPSNSNNLNIFYNGDQGGNLDLIVTESEARAQGLIAEQKLLLIPVPPSSEELKRAIRNRSKVRLRLGVSKINGREVVIRTRASMLLVKRGLEEAIKVGKHHIHIPTTSRAITRKMVQAIKLMKECGIIPSKYRVFEALLKDGDKTLEEWNNEDFAIVVGTRWMNRGTDTVKCDCQIYTYVPTSEAIAIQLKGRGHRTHDSKDYFLMVICEFEGELRANPLFVIAERELNGGGYAIIGNDPIQQDLNLNNENIEDLSGRTNPTVDALDNNEIVLLQGEGSDPEMFLEYRDLTEAITTDTYTDEYGNDLFSRMAAAKDLNYDIVAKKALEFESREVFRDNARSEHNWVMNRLLLDKVCKHMEIKRNKTWTFQMLWDKGILQKHKNWSLFIQDGNQGKIDNMSKDEVKKVRDYYGNQKSKPVDMLNEVTKEYITTFSSAKEAAKFIGKESSSSEINNCCNKKVMKNGKIKESFGGYGWRRSEINFKLDVK